MEDDDEFGNLYTDVLRPAFTASKPPPPPPRSENDDDGGRDGVRSGSLPFLPPSQSPAQSVVPDAPEGGDEDWIHGQARVPEERALDWSDGEEGGSPRVSMGRVAGLLPQRGGVVSVLMEEEEELAAGLVAAPREEVGVDEEGVGGVEDVGASVRGREAVVTPDVDNESADLDREPVIPGLPVASVLPGALDGAESGDAKFSRSDDWDSDSEDDLQIVLNDDNLGLASGNRVEDDDDEDGEDDLVIVTDEDQQQHHHHHPHHHQGMEEQGRGEESMQQPLDGERKEKSDGTRGNGEIGTVGMAKVGYSSHAYHGQHHPQFKYIRPGVAAIPGGAAVGNGAASGQVHPPRTMGPIAGRGRGEQKGFHSGYGLVLWASGTSARAYGSGLEFTLPSHKTIFEIDIDDFEEKRWRLPGVDISDFFNFGLDEEKWRVFCKQLEQLRLEATMQSKIRVYESGRSEKDYDPDLPPELAAAIGHDISAESTQHGKADSEQADLIGQGRGSLCLRPQLPIGRAIQVESGFGERLPSIDTRPRRMRDSDAIIEIVLQDSVDACSGPLDRQLYERQGQDTKGDDEDEEDDKSADSEHFNHCPPACSGGKVVAMKRKGSPMVSVDNNVIEGNGTLTFPPDASSNYLTTSKSQTPVIADDHYVASRVSRRTQSNASAECSNDTISSQSVELQRHNGQKERSGHRMEDEGILQISPVASPETAVEVRLEKRSDEHNDKVALDDDAEIGKEEMASELQFSGECHGDNAAYHAVKKQKLSSQVEQLAVQDKDSVGDSRPTHSDNSRATSGSSKDNLKGHESGEEEAMQSGQTRQIGDLTGHHHVEERSFHQRDDYGRDGRHDINRSHITSKRREDMYQSHLHKEQDSTNYGRRSEAFESGKKRDDSFGGCLRRELDVYGRRGKNEDRKHDHDDEIGSMHRNKVKVRERKGKDEDLHSRKHIGDGDRKGHDRVGATRQRERDSISMSRHDNFDDLRVRRKKDEEQTRRAKLTKKDALHVRRGMEGTTHGKREKGNGANNKSREDQTSVKNKVENHFTKHRDDNLRHREREDRQLNKFNEDVHTHKKREEGHIVVKGGRVLDDKHVGGIEKVNSVPKGLGSEDYPPKDRRRHSEHHKGGDHIDEHPFAQHKARQKMCPHENQSTNRGKNSKNERFSSHNNHSSAASDSQQVCRESHRENLRKNKESKGGQTSFLAAGKRKQDQKCHLNEKVSAKDTNEQEGRNMSSGLLSKKGHHVTDKPSDIQEQPHSPGNHAEEDVASDDDTGQNVRRGRSKLERWTSHKEERDYSNSSPQPLPPSRARESGVSNVDIIPLGDSIKNEDCNDADSDAEDAEIMQLDHVEEEGDSHLDTVAKLKRLGEPSERPMPGEDTMMTKNPENEVPLIQSGTVADAEIMEERPTRKRRWNS